MVWFKDIEYLVNRYNFSTDLHEVQRFAQISLYYLIISSIQQAERLSFKGIDFSRELDQTCCIVQFHFLIAIHCKILLDNPLMISINAVLIFYH